VNLDDDALRGHLARRARGAAASERLADSVAARVGRTDQPSAWRTWWADRAPAIGAAGVAAVAVIVAAIVVAAPPAEPGASTEPGPIAGYLVRRALTANELARVVAGTPAGLWGSGAHVVADVEIVRAPIPCDYGRTSIPCPTGYLAGVEPRVHVTESIALVVDDELVPPILFQLRPEWPGSLFAIGEVASAPGALAWSLDAFIAHRRALGPGARPPSEVFLVDAWLVQTDAAYRCVPPTGDEDPGFACGDAAWLAPSGERASEAPAAGVRVQNAALQLFGRGPAPRQPERAIFAVALEDAPGCFECPPGGAVRIVARVDPVDLPAESPATGSIGRDPTLSPSDLGLEAAPPDSDFDAASTAAIVASARKGAIFLDPPVSTHRLVAAQVQRDPALNGAVVEFHDYEGGGLVVAGMIERPDGWAWTDIRHETGLGTLSSWELVRLEAGVRADPLLAEIYETIESITAPRPSECRTRSQQGGFCAMATIAGTAPTGTRQQRVAVVELAAPAVSEVIAMDVSADPADSLRLGSIYVQDLADRSVPTWLPHP
jgi:hypothetical protein